MPKMKDLKKVVVIGAGPIVIGQAAEFDYAGTQACLALKEEGIEVVLINNNPATIMTDPTIADRVYMEPLTVESVEAIIKKENPDGLIGTLGGQTGLNLTVDLFHAGILEKYGVQILGTSVNSIQMGEDRELFRQLMLSLNEPILNSCSVNSNEQGLEFAKQADYPLIIRPAYTLGGEGGGFAYNEKELIALMNKGLSLSPVGQILIERSIKGWKEIEYEVMRDSNDTCIIVCNMENMDPVGVHTGDSIVVAPSQTLTDTQYQMLRDASLKIIRALGIIGGCNIQFALDPQSNQYYIIEVNPRVSRSSALASKATGYPIARIAAKCAVGYNLDEIINPITGNTFASFEPSIDYIVVKLPRFPFDKFPEADRTLGTQMKATGEVMAIDRNFEGALNKAIRSLGTRPSYLTGVRFHYVLSNELLELIKTATDERLFQISELLRRGMEVEIIHSATSIDLWFLEKIKKMVELENEIRSFKQIEEVPLELIQRAKKNHSSDQFFSDVFGMKEKEVRSYWELLKIKPVYKQVDTCAAEFEAVTPYYYSTWHGEDEVNESNKPKILVIGSGPIRIGQGIEFDYCSVHAALALKKKGYEAIVINNNPETVSTDYAVADRLYFEPLAVEDILQVIKKEKITEVFIQFGGQTAINVAEALHEEGIVILGTSLDSIDAVEDREQFYQLLNRLNIPHIEGKTVGNAESLLEAGSSLGYPVLVRPSYVIGGQAMFIFFNEEDLLNYKEQLLNHENPAMWPLLIDRYYPGLECEVDVISDGKNIVIPGIMEHIEKAGVHSGDSIALFPPVSLSEEIKDVIVAYSKKIAQSLPIIGLMNIQFVLYNDTVYVLEVNPRASRTTPIMSKVTGVPMIEWAVRCQLGESLNEMASMMDLMQEPNYYVVKQP
ncbi:MAG: carbamoyl-phosphate synthase (glutamine-hydrolyzing) large subunit, partial [Bacillota bacterium]|nr:carbamoyl-phosphate synthase (glutamine-hydrolyzing) large subunit [Bacillota bacterium]